MAVTTLVSSVTKDDQTYYSVTSPNSSGTFIFDIDEANFTDKMKKELMGVLVLAYDNSNVPLENRNVLWNKGSDDGVIIIKVPTSFKVQIQAVVDERYVITYPGETLDTTFPVTVKFDSANTDSGSGGGGGGGSSVTVLDGDIKDNKTSGDVVTAQQVAKYVDSDADLAHIVP